MTVIAPLTNPVKTAPFNIPSLDGIRILAFIIVFFAHTADLGKRLIPGGFGVTIFFFLSGYLITTLMRREAERTGGLNFKAFYLRRIIRIFPPFYAILAIGLLLTAAGLLPTLPTWDTVLSQLFYYVNYRMALLPHEGFITGSTVFWSLAVEEHFYFLFPFVYWAMLRLKLSPSAQAYTIWGLCALNLLWRFVLVHGFFEPGLISKEYFEYASDVRLDSMLFGCALAVHGNPALDTEGRVSDSRWRSWGLPAAIGLLVLSLMIRNEVFRYTLRYSLQGLVLYPFFICAIRYSSWGPFRWLNHPWVKKLGQLSYVLYLVHFTVLLGIRPWFPHNAEMAFRSHPLEVALYAATGFAISLALAFILHYSVERPALQLKRRFSV